MAFSDAGLRKNLFLMAAAALLCAVGPLAEGAEPVGLVLNHGFCVDGVWGNTQWPNRQRPKSVSVWGSFCTGGDHDTGRVETQPFVAPAVLNLYLAGYVGLPGRRLLLKNVESGDETELKPSATPGDEWRFHTLPVPREWVGKPVQLAGDDQATGIQGWLGFTLPFLLPSALTIPVVDTSAPPGDLCANGVFSGTKWAGGAKPAGVTTWGTFCKKFDADTGWIASQPVIAESYLSMYVAGYPGNPGLRLVAENVETGRQLPLLIAEPPAETWRLFHFRLPSEWRGQTMRIVAEDTATGTMGWLGFSDPVTGSVKAEASTALRIVGMTLVLGLIVLLPSVAACLLAAVRGVEDELDLMTIGFLALGVSGYVAFWSYFFSRGLGNAYSVGGVVVCCAVSGYCCIDRTRRSRIGAVRALLVPVAVVMLAAVCVMSLGLVDGGEKSPLSLAAGRFGPPHLAADNEIPKWFADGIWVGHIPRPLMSEWLSSDRPPLQTGNALWIYPFTHEGSSGNRDLAYQAISVLLQCSFLAGLWSFLRACKIDGRLLGLAMASCFFSGFTLLNEFYVWPKLYPVGFLLIVCAYLLTERFEEIRNRPMTGALLGGCVAFAALCHGSSMFAIFGLGAYLIALRRWPSWRFLGAMAAAVVVVYTPWTLYQKFVDPPGDHLLKWHVAGEMEPKAEDSFGKLLIRNYGKLTRQQLFDLKGGNFTLLWNDEALLVEQSARLAGAVARGEESTRDSTAQEIRRIMFHHWFAAVDLAILGPLALLLAALMRRHRTAEYVAAWRMWVLTAVTLVVWTLLMFGPTATYPHQGPYLTEELALAGSCMAFWCVRPVLGWLFVAVRMVWTVVVFAWLTPSGQAIAMGGTRGPGNWVLWLVCLGSVVGMGLVLAGWGRGKALRAAG
jgi:hypothetical protein